MRWKAGLFLGGLLIGIAFAIFPFSGIAETWAAQNASSEAEVYQIVALVAIALAAFAMLISGLHQSIPYPPLGFVAFIAVLGLVAWVGIGMILGG